MGRTIEVKMAKATKEDMDRVRRFLEMIEEVMEYGTYTEPSEDDEDESEPIGTERLFELIEAAWNPTGLGVGTSWRRVVYGCEILIDNACDPEADTLEWRPDIKAAMEAAGNQDDDRDNSGFDAEGRPIVVSDC